MGKTVLLTLFDLDGSVFHSYDAEVVSETSDTTVVKVPDHDEDYYLETYSKVNGQCLDDRLPLDPHYIMMTAQEPIKNSFIHLPKSWWQSYDKVIEYGNHCSGETNDQRSYHTPDFLLIVVGNSKYIT